MFVSHALPPNVVHSARHDLAAPSAQLSDAFNVPDVDLAPNTRDPDVRWRAGAARAPAARLLHRAAAAREPRAHLWALAARDPAPAARADAEPQDVR